MASMRWSASYRIHQHGSRKLRRKPWDDSHVARVLRRASGASSSPYTGAIKRIKHPAGTGSPSHGTTYRGPLSRRRRSDWQK
eukprot:9669042-Lingulodinium_polyedra.AAC.1